MFPVPEVEPITFPFPEEPMLNVELPSARIPKNGEEYELVMFKFEIVFELIVLALAPENKELK